jgi:Zn finger protein HypA/HybF involved in hydrogenase expression
LYFYDAALKLVDKGVPVAEIREVRAIARIGRLKYVEEEKVEAYLEELKQELKEDSAKLSENFTG